ncbi:MAG: TlpA disulfide reductase family protein [Pseudomonadota bacterium]
MNLKRLTNSTPFLAFLVVIIALYFALSGSPSRYEEELTNQELELINGEKLDLKSLKGEYYIIHLFASWCNICKQDYKLLNKIIRDTNVTVIGLAVNDKISKLKTQNKFLWPYKYIAIDHDRKIAKLVKNKAIPETIIVNPEGRVIFYYIGGLDYRLVENRIIPMLNSNQDER